MQHTFQRNLIPARSIGAAKPPLSLLVHLHNALMLECDAAVQYKSLCSEVDVIDKLSRYLDIIPEEKEIMIRTECYSSYTVLDIKIAL